MIDRMPPPIMVILAIIGFQLGTVIAKPAIEAAGPVHTVFLRVGLGAVLLLLWKRPSFKLDRNAVLLIIASAATMLLVSLLIFAAIQRIPVGIAIAIEFWGPMVVAIYGSRRLIDFFWVGLAVAGILLFTPLADASFDTVGVLLAALAGAAFGGAIVFSSKLGHIAGGIPAAGLSMAAATVMIAPFSLGTGLFGELNVDFIGRMIVVAVLTNVVGFALEFTALTRIRPSLYAILISLEPAVGAILGLAILDEHIGLLGAAGIGAVTAASLGASRTNRHEAGGRAVEPVSFLDRAQPEPNSPSR